MSSHEAYLTFTVAGRGYAIPGWRVLEVMRLDEAASTAQFDLRSFFGESALEQHDRRCAIVVRIGPAAVGLIADEATDVVFLTAADLLCVPSFGPRIRLPYLAALARTGDVLSIVLDVDQLLSAGELDALRIDEAAV